MDHAGLVEAAVKVGSVNYPGAEPSMITREVQNTFHMQELELRTVTKITFPDNQSSCVKPVSVGSCRHLTEEGKCKPGCCQTSAFNMGKSVILKLGYLKKRRP